MDYSILDPLRENALRSGVLTDLDGTISPIAPTPEEARVDGETRKHLCLLNGGYGLVAVVSGRPVKQAIDMVGIGELVYSGNHGLELMSGGKTEVYKEAGHFQKTIRRIRDGISQFNFPDIIIEDKGIGGFAVHYRNSNDPKIRDQLDYLLHRAIEGSSLTLTEGRKVFEVRPNVQRDKGDIVKELCRGHELQGAIYIGDDLADRDAFRGLRGAGMGTSICIAVDSPEVPEGLKESADVVLPSQKEVINVFKYLQSGSD